MREALGIDAAERFTRTLYHGLLTSVDYKYHLRGLEKGSDEYVAAQRAVNLRAARRILHVCQEHGGVFTKAGQYLSSLVKILPDEITDTLRVLQDRNPGEPFEDVCRVVAEDFGTPLSSLYASFEVRLMGGLAGRLGSMHGFGSVDLSYNLPDASPPTCSRRPSPRRAWRRCTARRRRTGRRWRSRCVRFTCS